MLAILIRRVEETLEALLNDGTPICLAWSAGKDSSCCANLLLTTASRLNSTTPIVILYGETGVENPEVELYAEGEIEAIRNYARAYNLNVRIETARPTLSSSWPVRVIGGRGLPIFANGDSRDCTIDWKIQPMRVLRNKVMSELGMRDKKPVIITGVRFDESESRAARMTARGENDQVRQTDSGEQMLSPICYWSDSDVWEYLGDARSGKIESYSDFDETFRIYADSAGTSCAVVADDILGRVSKSRACGARTGCWACAAVGIDKSLTNMIQSEERYRYLTGLNKLQQFIVNTQYDWTRRNWIGRTIQHGYIQIKPDTYSPGMLEELLRYALTLDYDEALRAQDTGEKKRFQIVSPQALIAIDAMWSLYGHARPCRALKIFRDIYVEGNRYPVPDTEPMRPVAMLNPRYVHVGEDWDQDFPWAYTGLRNPELELMYESDCIGRRELNNGTSVMDVNTSDRFEVDEEGALLVLDLELDYLIEKYHDDPDQHVTAGYMYYITAGVLTLSHGQVAEHDNTLRRTAFKSRNGFIGEVDLQELLQRSVPFEETGMQGEEEVMQMAMF